MTQTDIFRLDLSRLSALVVDDNNHLRRITKAMVAGFGIRNIFEATDGLEGLQLYESVSPDIILVDWDMPIMNGVEMTLKIRHSEKGDPQVPIIMLSSRTEKHRVLEARDSGITEFVVKPMSAKSLFLRVANAVSQPRDFVKTKTFYGPDRRRFVHPTYSGAERRKSEQGSNDNPTTENTVEDGATA